MATIAAAMKPGDRLIVAAHSLGSVVTHNYVVRNWTASGGRLPDTLITFGSPIGLLTWIWLFLDFHDMDFNRPVRSGRYFCWEPIANQRAARRPLSWINILNCVDPIATSFPTGALDLSAATSDIVSGLKAHPVPHLHLGDERVSSVGVAHTRYFDDKKRFLEVVLRAAGLNPGEAADVEPARSEDGHRTATARVLWKVQWGLYALALLGMASYCGLIARRFAEPRVLWAIVLFAWPPLTIGMLAFFQRLMFGGPTKRIEQALIRELKWLDTTSLAYRLRDGLGLSRDVDPMEKSPGYGVRLLLNVASFLPTLIAMLIPLAAAAWLSGHRPGAGELAAGAFSLTGLLALAAFSAYVIACALHELVRAWRRILHLTA